MTYCVTPIATGTGGWIYAAQNTSATNHYTEIYFILHTANQSSTYLAINQVPSMRRGGGGAGAAAGLKAVRVFAKVG